MMVCEDCGTEGDEDNRVNETVCPFAEEIHGETVEVTLCARCEEKRAGDI